MYSIKHPSRDVMDISICPATRSDTEFITRLSGLVFSIYGPYEEIVPNWFLSGKTPTVMARMGERPLGFTMIGNFTGRYDHSAAAEILAIAVEPDFHNMGIGGMLLKKIEEKAIKLNIKVLFLHTAVRNLQAQRLFKNKGYRLWEVKKDFYQGRQDAYLMAKEIQAPLKTSLFQAD